MIAIHTPELVRLKTGIETGLQNVLAASPDPLGEAMAYGTLSGGKRVRGMLVLAAAEAVGGDGDKALPAALAIELVHAFSLIHDDLPSLDDSPQRRGQPSCHVRHGEAIALLAGDALLALAFETLAAAGDVRQVAELAQATGAGGMCGGQALELTGSQDVVAVHQRKTGALFRCAVRLGALAGAAEPGPLAALTGVGEHIGLAFQIVDDLLDHEEDQGLSFVRSFGAEAARQRATAEVNAALDLLATFPASADPLRALCRAVIERHH